jgi:hypothetical protein
MTWHENVAFAFEGRRFQGTFLAAHHTKENTAITLETFNIRPVSQPTQQSWNCMNMKQSHGRAGLESPPKQLKMSRNGTENAMIAWEFFRIRPAFQSAMRPWHDMKNNFRLGGVQTSSFLPTVIEWLSNFSYRMGGFQSRLAFRRTERFWNDMHMQLSHVRHS